jgi:hypothetical protein
MAGAPIDNNNNEYSLEEMKRIIADFCAHRSKGYSKESFTECDYRTIDRHLEVHSIELQAEKRAIEQAERECRLFWEKEGIENMYIQKDGGSFNSAVWIFNMKNRFNWKDRTDVTSNEETINRPPAKAKLPDGTELEI